jgi:hypothetical protein
VKIRLARQNLIGFNEFDTPGQSIQMGTLRSFHADLRSLETFRHTIDEKILIFA